jgi:RHS repeat-associated protein
VTTGRGDVRALTDTSGEAFAFYSYDAYGNPLACQTRATASLDATTSAEIAGANVLRYAGYAYDAHSGLYYCSARYYDPATASFITKDPAKADGEESAYQYCGGDPVGKVDPSGLRTKKGKWHLTSCKLTVVWTVLNYRDTLGTVLGSWWLTYISGSSPGGGEFDVFVFWTVALKVEHSQWRDVSDTKTKSSWRESKWSSYYRVTTPIVSGSLSNLRGTERAAIAKAKSLHRASDKWRFKVEKGAFK